MKLSFAATLLFSSTSSSLISSCHGWTLFVPLAAPINHHAAAAAVVDASLASSSSELSSNYYHQSTERITKYAMEWLKENTLPQPAFAADDDVVAATGPPTNAEIQLLRNAFAAFYGSNRDAAYLGSMA